MKLQSIRRLRGEVIVPGDKSISHRAVMFGALAEGKTEITGFLRGADCLSTISCFRQLGISIEETADKIIVHGKGLHGLRAPVSTLDTGNSGTTMRLISGILAGQNFTSVLTGDSSIQRRPMRRIMTPLSQMGASIRSIKENNCAPLEITGSSLHGISYMSPVASAQVKSAVLLAGLYADGETSVTETAISRNHTELMLRSFGADIRTDHLTATIRPNPALHAMDIHVPGDISSASYFIVAGSLVPDSEILIRNVGINPTRDGIIRVAREMGADITLFNEKNTGEPVADLLVKSRSLHGITIGGDIIPTLIDELPIIAVMAAAADGTTVIRDAAELKVKESDRIAVMTENLSAMGCDITATQDGMIIHGRNALQGAVIDPHSDHRIAMSFAVAAMIADGETEIKDAGCVTISYPDFYDDLKKLGTK
ncbi:3-phosphoshikimate 1-carboxyvinyltransferase [bacterium 1XD8-76]|nr:3-phosphoshikimate 1-carboxyvinyltransferase [bacterium 1XD8-76]